MDANQSAFSYCGKAEALSWLAKHEIPVDESGCPRARFGDVRTAFALTPQARSQLIVAWKLGKLLDHKRGLFLITDWPLYTDVEMEIFAMFRAGHEEVRRLIDSPGCIFDVADSAGLKFIAEKISLLFAFNWQGFIFSADKSVTVWLADEVVEVWSQDRDTIRELEPAITDLRLSRLN